MALFYRNGSYVSDYIKSDGTYVSAHYRNGTYIDFEKYCIYYDPYYKEKSNLFVVKCFDCGQEVYFVRNTTYFGCFLADEIDPEWIIHPCWENKQVEQEKMKHIIDYYKVEFIKSQIEYKEKNQQDIERIKKRLSKKKSEISKLPLKNIKTPLDYFFITGVVFGHVKCGTIEELILYSAEAYFNEFRFKVYIHYKDFYKFKPYERINAKIKSIHRGKALVFYVMSDRFNMSHAVKQSWIITPGLIPRHKL